MMIKAIAVGAIGAMALAMFATVGLFREPDDAPTRQPARLDARTEALAWQSWRPVRPARAVAETTPRVPGPPPAGEPPPAGLDPGVWATPATFDVADQGDD